MMILVYEEDKNLGEMLKYYLTVYLNHRVSLADTEKKALALAGAFSFDAYMLCHGYCCNISKLVKVIPEDKLIIITTAIPSKVKEEYKKYLLLKKPFDLVKIDKVLVPKN